MYGKFFASTFTGSMYGAGPDVFAVWGYAIATANEGVVELNPAMLAAMLGTTPERIEAAIEWLERPDPKSRNPQEAGRRLIREGPFAFRVVSHALYRAIRNEEERRAYNRYRQRECRTRRRNNSSQPGHTVGQSQSLIVAHSEAEAEAEAEEEKTKSRSTTTKTARLSEHDPAKAPASSRTSTAVPSADGKATVAACQGWQEAAGRDRDALELSGLLWADVRAPWGNLVLAWRSLLGGQERVAAEIAKAASWLAERPARRKAMKKPSRFLGNWMRRAADEVAVTVDGNPPDDDKPAYPYACVCGSSNTEPRIIEAHIKAKGVGHAWMDGYKP